MNRNKIAMNLFLTFLLGFVIFIFLVLQKSMATKETFGIIDIDWFRCIFWGFITFVSLFIISLLYPTFIKKQFEKDPFRYNFYKSVLTTLISFLLLFFLRNGKIELITTGLISFIVFMGSNAIFFIWDLSKYLKRFTKTTLEEIWDKTINTHHSCRISEGLNNAHIATLQYYHIIPTRIINNDQTYCGHTFIKMASFAHLRQL